jgi:hypothetical protein
MLRVTIDNDVVYIRDQKPLHKGNVDLRGGWTFECLVKELNSRVFFWPGDDDGPIPYGTRHFDTYVDSRPVILRVPTAAAFSNNPSISPQFCRFNSGSPRCTGGHGSPRGPDTFLTSDQFGSTSGDVKEVTFLCQFKIPHSAEWADTLTGPWSRF